MESYIDRIKQIKGQKKMTNEQLAERSGIPLGTLSKLLAGMSESPKLSNIVAICNALDCTVEYIVTGTPENTNNYTLTEEEIALVEAYRRLDGWGQGLVGTVLAKETERVDAVRGSSAAPSGREPAPPVRPARILHMPAGAGSGRYAGGAKDGKRSIPLYDLPVSAGIGEYLEDARAETIRIPRTDATAEADYALRISGDSMEPRYHNGDVLLVQTTDSVEIGEPGIFLLDGCGYFKIYGGSRLLSLNPAYSPIPLSDFSDVQCRGRVIGRLRKK